MLTGNFPFDGENLILRGVTKRQEQLLLEKDVEPALAAIILKMMACRPDDRYQTARSVKEDLQNWQNIHLSADEIKAAWDIYNRSHDAANAEKKFLEMLARYPHNPQAYLEVGRFYIQCSREDNAIEVLSRGIAIAPDYGQLWNARGRLYAKRNSPLAVEDLGRALELDLPAKEKQHIRVMLRRLT
jgi:tetratricopeptide (TPR) repeat protein